MKSIMNWLRLLAERLGLTPRQTIFYICGNDVLPPPLPREREAELLERLEDEGARTELIEHNLRLVVYIARRFENTGVYIEDLDVTTKPCRAWQTGSHTFHIVLTQGLNRQIRRMCRALDYHVMNLKRLRIMNIKLGHLERGQYRELFPDEVESLRKMLEGSTNLPKSEQMKIEAKKKPSEKPAQKRPEAFKEGSKVYRTVPKFYPNPEEK